MPGRTRRSVPSTWSWVCWPSRRRSPPRRSWLGAYPWSGCGRRWPRPCRRAVDQVPDLIPYDARGKKALELTFREALRLGHDYVGTEHILLALIEEEDGKGVLADLGLEKAAVEEALIAAIAEAARRVTPDGSRRRCRSPWRRSAWWR